MRRLSFRLKLLLAFGCIAALAGALLFYQSQLTLHVQAQYEDTTRHEIKRLGALETISTIVRDTGHDILLYDQNKITAEELQAKIAGRQKDLGINEEIFHTHVLGIEPAGGSKQPSAIHADAVKLLQRAAEAGNLSRTSALFEQSYNELLGRKTQLSKNRRNS
jgi:hypothetical protein